MSLGLCHCGCGQPTSLATKTNRQYGHVKGQPMRYLRGHQGRLSPEQQPARPARKRAYNKLFHEINRESIQARKQQWYQANRKHVLTNAKQRRRENAAHVHALDKAWRQRNAERCRVHSKTYRAKNPEKWTAIGVNAARRRRARKLNLQTETFTRHEIWTRDHGLCGICGLAADPTKWHLDHIIPLDKQGPDTRANVRVTHPRCNLKKWAHLPVSSDL